MENRHDADVDTAREALMLAKNVYRAYKRAPYEVKRLYLSFFWDKIWARDKKIIRAKPTELFENLVEEKQLVSPVLGTNFLLNPNWLLK